MIITKKKHSLLLFIFILFACAGCSVSKNQYYSYTVKTYSIEAEKSLVSVSNLISYRDYLFEFITEVKIEDSISGGSGDLKRQVTYNNKGGVYLLKKKSNLYLEFDSFSLNNKLIKQGKISEKEFGVKLKENDTSFSSNAALFKTSPLDSIINGVRCFYIDINLKDSNVNSSYEQKIFLYKDKHFNSFYKLGNVNYIDSNYCMIGTYFFDRSSRQGIVEEPDNVRVLTKAEQRICESIIKKASPKY